MPIVEFDRDFHDTREEFAAAVMSALDAGGAVHRETAVREVGWSLSIAWWDDEAFPAGADVSRFDGVDAGGFAKAERADIPDVMWAKHREDYARPGGHGLALEDEPAFIGVVRAADGSLRAMIGYRLS